MPSPHLALIYARAENGCIGKHGKIPWHLPADFAHFKRTTMGKPILMGRKTYEDHKTRLPGRLNVVITRSRDYQPVNGVRVCHSLEDAIDLAHRQTGSDVVFIIGGTLFFNAALPMASHVYETVVHADIEGDAFLKAYDFSNWKTETLFEHPTDERHAHAFTVYHHCRRPNSSFIEV
ncbi:MAG: dihydrofolate reductase [Planctomycetota bacterium]